MVAVKHACARAKRAEAKLKIAEATIVELRKALLDCAEQHEYDAAWERRFGIPTAGHHHDSQADDIRAILARTEPKS